MIRIFAALIGSALMLAACASGGPSGAVSASLPPPDAPRLQEAREHIIGPQDTLEVTVFQADQLNRTVEVDAQGKIDLPLIGVVTAAGKSARQLSGEIAANLEKKYLQSPQVTVRVKESLSQRVTVEGAVTSPGVFPVSGPTTLLQAIAMAQGPVREANEKQVAIFRTVNDRRAVALFDLTAIRQGKAEDPLVYGNDVVVVERSGAKSILNDIRGIVPIIGVFRWF
jgi:polysaccharide export outer membrane protein